MSLRARLLLSVIAIALAIDASLARADEYPSKPIRLVLPFAPGGGADTVARIVAQSLADVLGQPVVVDNRAGGGATIGTELGARAIADGYTLLIASSTSLSVNPVLMKVRYDPMKDFSPITLLGTQPHIVVLHPSVPAKFSSASRRLRQSCPT
jgi:tripartite-type tricarboxylate transporter receptor subunit TctC